MAIQMRRGVYAKLDKKRLVPGEFAVVQSGDPDSSNGMGAYVCFSANNTKKLMTQEDITTELINSEKDAAKQITDNATAYVKDAEAARVSAENTRVSNENARNSAESTRVSNENTRVSNENARKSAESAREAAQAKNNSDQAKNNELANNGVAYTILTSSQVDSNTGKPTITGTKGTMYFAPVSSDENSAYVEWVYPNGAWERVSPVVRSGYSVTTDNGSYAGTIGTQAASGATTQADSMPMVPATLRGLGLALSAFRTALASLFAAKSHTHSASDITSGALPVANGGTGQTTLQATRNAMGLGDTTGALPVANGGTGQTTLQATRNAMGLGDTTGALPVANGGTGSTTASAARAALGEVSLFYSQDGVAGSVTLSETASNFQRIMVWGAKVEGSHWNEAFGCVAHPKSSGDRFSGCMVTEQTAADNSTEQFLMCTFGVKDTTLYLGTAHNLNSGQNPQLNNDDTGKWRIFRVVGIRY